MCKGDHQSDFWVFVVCYLLKVCNILLYLSVRPILCLIDV
jgi:hypothetical protein